MAQKNKVKELVGRGLNSYHTKALQQMDRIEKKNKEQNHKISILSNELDNDYLTKTEEGSVISLEHSKEGMVYLDELQGNTLVNYCTDGSKEMTLNGDIDVEGSFVTTTEGVDNGKIDVLCEGNTLVNLGGKVNKQSNRYGLLLSSTMILKPSTLYTFIVTNLGNQSVQFYRNESVFNATTDRSKVVPANSTIVFTWETLSNLTDNGLIKSEMDGATQFTLDVVLLEGDWTNREIPQYFEGMKSVGQDDINGHKIEILSENENLWRGKEIYYPNNCKIIQSSDNEVIFESVNVNQGLKVNIQRFKNKKLSLSYDMEVLSGNVLNFGGHNRHNDLGMYVDGVKVGNIYHNGYTKNYEIGRKYRIEVILDIDNNVGQNGTNHQIQDRGEIGIEPNRYTGDNPQTCRVKVSNFVLKEITNYETSTQYFQPKYNKKEILINEPLRSLPNGVKDKLVKIGNRWFVERNCGVVVANETKNYILDNVNLDTRSNISAYFRIDFQFTNGYRQLSNKILTSHFVEQQYDSLTGSIGDLVGIGTVKENDTTQRIIFSIPKTKLTSLDENGFISYFRQNPTKVIYQLKTPIYEPLEVEPTLNTYNDITHISNNSIIPCTMKIKNSGYNAIIKPSTLYTVALDTNKNGIIGLNLGGAKVTTTNNVATITTPATLTDDSLRLYGKGIKGSKVRLLEGDKTNWIPSHFEGIKSSFEDKAQSDGTYKMEILSSNENLFDLQKLVKHSTNNTFEIIENGFIMTIPSGTMHSRVNYNLQNLDKNKTYRLNYKVQVLEYKTGANIDNDYIGYCTGCKYYPLKSNKYTSDIDTNQVVLGFHNSNLDGITKVKFYDIQIKEVSRSTINNFTSHKHNKIQFSSIEPLRRGCSTKDRLVFVDNQLKIERNCGYRVLNGSEGWTKFNNPTTKVSQFYTHNPLQKNGTGDGACTVVPFTGSRNANNEREGLGLSGGAGDYIWVDVYNHRLTTIDVNGFKSWLRNNNIEVVYQLAEPTYEEIPFELQKIILEGYENGTLFFDTNIPPTATVTYAGETPIVKATKLNKTEVLNNTEDINDNIIPYLMDMDYRVVMLQLATEELEGGVSMARLFGGTYEMIKRDILSKRLTREEYGYRLADYFNAGKLTEEQVRELEELR